jgi:ubiquitin carboxyl-terminal hydrolase 4/11/15
MNAALQCLSNTRELRDYFLRMKIFLFKSSLNSLLFLMRIESYYLVELNRTNPLGMNGTMAEEFANVIKNLWSGQTSFTYANLLRVRFI